MIMTKNRLNAFLMLCFALLPANHAHAVARWAETIADSTADYRARAIEPTSDGGYILAGRKGVGVEDGWCAKLDVLGNVTWQYTYGGMDEDTFSDVRPLSDGTYFVTGHTRSFGAGSDDIWCLLLGAAGNVIWQKTYGGGGTDVGFSGEPIPGGGFVVVGETDSFGSGGDDDVLCLRLDAAGNVIWQKAYGGDGADDDAGVCVQQTADNGFIIAGNTYGGHALWCLKLDSSGNVTWQRYYGPASMAWATEIRQTTDGGYIMSGLIGGPALDSCVLKLTANGAVSWQTFIARTGPEYPMLYDVRQTSDGDYIASGAIRMGSMQDNAWFVGLGTNGNIVWQKAAGGNENDSAIRVRPTIDGGFVLVGETRVSGKFGVFVSHTSAAGDIDASCNIQDTAVVATSPSIEAGATDGVTITTAVTVVDTSAVPAATPAIAEQSCSSPAAPDLTGSWSNVGFKRSKLKGTFTCLNAGAAAAGSSTVKVYFSKKGTIGRKAALIKTQGVAGLAAFGTSSFTINATPGSKYKYVVATLDTGNTVAEDDEGNNIVAWRFR